MGHLVEGHWFESWLPLAACRSVLEQDTKSHVAPYERLKVPCKVHQCMNVCGNG